MTAAAPAWARGLDLDFLREIAALYKADFGPHTYGQFGIPKERDVADAAVATDLMWRRSPVGNRPIIGAAIFRRVARPSPHKDFADRVATMQPGDIFFRSMAGQHDALVALLARALFFNPPAVWVEAHVECETATTALSSLGFERVLTKVSASSDLKGLFLMMEGTDRTPPRLPERLEWVDAIGARVLDRGFLDADALEAIGLELAAYLGAGGEFAQHYSGYNKGKSWSAFALRGYDATDPGFIVKPSEMSKAWKADNPRRLLDPCQDTIAAAAFPKTMAALSRIPGSFQRVRFMRLAPSGGELTRHADITDPEAGTKDGEIARLHIPLATDPKCRVRSWRLNGEEGRLHFPQGSLCYLDTRKPHAVLNPAASERVHLVVDVRADEQVRALIGAPVRKKADVLAGY